jgi:hypothetical protein
MLNDDFQIKFYLYKQIQLMEENNMNSMNMPKEIKTKKGLYLHFVSSIFSQFIFVCLH